MVRTNDLWTWHSPGGDYLNQIDYIMVKRRFQSSVNIAKTKSSPGADTGSGHELVMMTFGLPPPPPPPPKGEQPGQHKDRV